MGLLDLFAGSTFGWQNKLGATVGGVEQGIGAVKGSQLSLGQYGVSDTRSMSGIADRNKFLSGVSRGQGYAASVSQRLGLYTDIATKQLGSNTALGQAALGTRSGVLNFANKINDHLSKTGRGVAGGFQSVGSLMSRMPMKHLARSYAIGTPAMIAMEVGLMGKPLSMSTVAEAAWHNIPFTLSMELAGGGMKGIAKGMGYGMVGSAMGLGPWGTLALQVAGSTYLPGVAPTAAVVMGAYNTGKGLYDLHKQMYKMGKGARKTEFVTGDMSYATAEAATMRQRSIGAIQKSHLNMRSMLGREATILMGR